MPLTAKLSLDPAKVPFGGDIIVTGSNDTVLAAVRFTAELEDADQLLQVLLTAKVALTDSDTAPTTVQKVVTPNAEPVGQIVQLGPNVYEAQFMLTPTDLAKLATKHFLGVKGWVQRGSQMYERAILMGTIIAMPNVASTTTLVFVAAGTVTQPGPQIRGTAIETFKSTGGAMTQPGPQLRGLGSLTFRGGAATTQPGAALAGGGDNGLFLNYHPGDSLASFGATLSRASTATYVDVNGVLQTAASGVLRDGHYVKANDGNTYRTTRIEDQRTNSYTFSEDLTNAVWQKQGTTTITADAIAAPDGNVTADKIVETAFVGSLCGILRGWPGAPSDNTGQSFSVYVKAAERTWVRVRMNAKDNTSHDAYFDLQNGVWGTVDAGYTLHTFSVLQNGWYRLSFSLNAGSGAAGTNVQVCATTGNLITTYNGVAGDGLYIWGLQFEVDAPFTSSYIPTPSSATVTRSADQLNGTDGFPDANSCWYAKFVEAGSMLLVSNRRVAQHGSGNTAADLQTLVYANTSSRYAITTQQGDGGNTKNSQATVTTSFNDLVELRGLVNPDLSVQIGQSLNGAAEALGSASTANPTTATLTTPTDGIGQTPAAAGRAFMSIVRLIRARGLLTQAQLRALT